MLTIVKPRRAHRAYAVAAREFARLGIVEKIKQELAEAAQETENE